MTSTERESKHIKLEERSKSERKGRPKSELKRQKVELELFVSGVTPKSIRAIEVLKELCETHFSNHYSLKIIDIYREPALAKKNEVFAVPTLICRQPGPKKTFIGDLSDAAPVLRAFGLKKGTSK